MVKNYVGLLLILFVTLLGVRPIFAQEKSNKLDEYFTALSRMDQFNGCVAVIADGKLIFDKAYTMPGPANLRVDKNSQFDIHSVSKLMAKAILVNMQAAGKLKLSHQVDRFFPDFPQGNVITLQMLIDHRSGLPRELSQVPGGKLNMSGPKIVAAAATEKLEFKPGTETRYSNVGYELLYQVIAQQTGHPFVEELQRLFFYPLGMSASGGALLFSPGKPGPCCQRSPIEGWKGCYGTQCDHRRVQNGQGICHYCRPFKIPDPIEPGALPFRFA